MSKNLNNEVERYFRDYISRDGLMSYNVNDPDKRTRNDNGIYFHMVALIMLKRLGRVTPSIVNRLRNTIRALEVRPGLYNRVPNSKKMEQHDNYIAIAGTTPLFGLPFAKDIMDEGCSGSFFFNFNNQEPGTITLKTQRQGGEIALYSYCANGCGIPLLNTWLLLGMLIGIYNLPKSKSASLGQLIWMRIEVLFDSIRGNRFSFVERFILRAVFKYWMRNVKKTFGTPTALFVKYYGPNHPIAFFADELFNRYTILEAVKGIKE